MRVPVLLALTVAVAAAPVGATTLTEDFETLGPRDSLILGPLVTAIGTFTPLAGTPAANLFLASPGYTNFGAGNNPTTSVILTANGDEFFRADLALAARTVATDVYLNDLGVARLRFYNGATLLNTITFQNADANFQRVSYTSPGALITRITFASTGGGTVNTGLDNIMITDGITTGVPEPASWALLIAGFGLVGAARRRQHKHQSAAT
jgi:hypothetical protein